MFQSIIHALCMCITSKIIFQIGLFMYNCLYIFYSHVNFSVTKISVALTLSACNFYSHVNFSVTKIGKPEREAHTHFYSHVNFSVTKIVRLERTINESFTVT